MKITANELKAQIIINKRLNNDTQRSMNLMSNKQKNLYSFLERKGF